MPTPKNSTSGYIAVWNIINTEFTAQDIALVTQELAGHDDRISAVNKVAELLHMLATNVNKDCMQMVYEHGKEGDRYGENPAAKDHYASQVWYALDAYRMQKYIEHVDEARERDSELVFLQKALNDASNGEMTKEQAEEAMKRI